MRLITVTAASERKQQATEVNASAVGWRFAELKEGCHTSGYLRSMLSSEVA